MKRPEYTDLPNKARIKNMDLRAATAWINFVYDLIGLKGYDSEPPKYLYSVLDWLHARIEAIEKGNK